MMTPKLIDTFTKHIFASDNNIISIINADNIIVNNINGCTIENRNIFNDGYDIQLKLMLSNYKSVIDDINNCYYESTIPWTRCEFIYITHNKFELIDCAILINQNYPYAIRTFYSLDDHSNHDVIEILNCNIHRNLKITNMSKGILSKYKRGELK